MSLNQKLSIIESILFAYGEPVDIKKLADICEVSQAAVIDMAKLLNDRYESVDSSLEVLRLDNCLQIATRGEYADYIKRVFETKRNSILSNAAMECLAIAAYNQPVTKGFIENIRGVDSSSVVNSLVEKGLLEEAGRLEVPGRPVAYKTTENFLRCFGISSLSELPPLSDESDNKCGMLILKES